MRRLFNFRLSNFCFAILLILCHGTGWAGIPPPTHDTAVCASCHQSGNKFAGAASLLVTQECVGCHTTLTAQTTVFHSTDRGQCASCHSFHEPSRITTSVGAIALTEAGNLDRAHCQSCHDPRGNLGALSPAHREAATLYHQEAAQLKTVSPSDACLRCHSNQSGSAWQTARDGRILAFNTHASHPYGVKVIPGQGNASNWISPQIDERIPLFAGVMECQSCHLLSVSQKDLLIPFETKYDLCRGCHQHYGDDTPGTTLPRATLANR